MGNKFVLLHISDTHFGKSEDGIDERTVIDTLLKDIKNVREERQLEPNIIVFSGDLVIAHK